VPQSSSRRFCPKLHMSSEGTAVHFSSLNISGAAYEEVPLYPFHCSPFSHIAILQI
jgi:hypothetical protein